MQHTTDRASPAGSAPAVCGSLASAAPETPADGVSVSTGGVYRKHRGWGGSIVSVEKNQKRRFY
nr:MAG TPA: hypothetical protein [Caudoviricetes sp.]